jgi:ammonia channel protein AmtB
MNILAPKLSFFQAVDDTLGVFHTHLVAGVVGGFLVGIFATAEGCAAFALTTPGGAIAGNGKQVGWQLAGALFIIGWNVVSNFRLDPNTYKANHAVGMDELDHAVHPVRAPGSAADE